MASSVSIPSRALGGPGVSGFSEPTSELAQSSRPPMGAKMIPMVKKSGSTVLGVRIGLACVSVAVPGGPQFGLVDRLGRGQEDGTHCHAFNRCCLKAVSARRIRWSAQRWAGSRAGRAILRRGSSGGSAGTHLRDGGSSSSRSDRCSHRAVRWSRGGRRQGEFRAFRDIVGRCRPMRSCCVCLRMVVLLVVKMRSRVPVFTEVQSSPARLQLRCGGRRSPLTGG